MSSAETRLGGVVRGRVQGVTFRASMAAEARRLALAGWVRNRADGSVEFEVAGSTDDVDALLAWARRGPPAARVDALDTAPRADTDALPRPFAVWREA